MSEENQQSQNPNQPRKGVIRKPEDLDLKQRLLSSPELFRTEKESDEYLDKLALKIKLFKTNEFSVDDFISEVMIKYETKFHKTWFYALADMFGADRAVMDVWVKPDFVRQFIIQAVYGRFPYFMLRELRKRKISSGYNNRRLYHYLTKNASEQLDTVIDQVYTIMKDCSSPLEFWMRYSKEYKIYFQTYLV